MIPATTPAHAGDAGPVLILGSGLIGAAVRSRLSADGCQVVSVARRDARAAGHLVRDLASADGRAALRRDLRRLAPRYAVVAHGPSDVTWIERHEDEAAAVHCGVAALLADARVPVLLVSTDNVFPGTRGGCRPGDRIAPANAYGRVKARAERLLLDTGRALILRVSLVYGWTDPTGPSRRRTYAQRCLEAALAGQAIDAPPDQSFTPVAVADVAEVISALATAARPITGARHLAGPEELSRYDFATRAYRIAGADAELVRPRPRRDTEWACRPRFSSLACSGFADVDRLARWRPRSPDQGLREMLGDRPRPPAPTDSASAGPASAGPASAGPASAGPASAGQAPVGQAPVGQARVGQAPGSSTPASPVSAGDTSASPVSAGERN